MITWNAISAYLWMPKTPFKVSVQWRSHSTRDGMLPTCRPIAFQPQPQLQTPIPEQRLL